MVPDTRCGRQAIKAHKDLIDTSSSVRALNGISETKRVRVIDLSNKIILVVPPGGLVDAIVIDRPRTRKENSLYAYGL